MSLSPEWLLRSENVNLRKFTTFLTVFILKVDKKIESEDGSLLKEYLYNRDEIVSGYIDDYRGETGDGHYSLD